MVAGPSGENLAAVGSVAGRLHSWRSIGLQMRVHRNSQSRQAPSQQKEVDLRTRRQRLEDAAGRRIDMGERAAEGNARAAAHVLEQRVNRVVEDLAVKLPHASHALVIVGQLPLDFGK